MHDFERLLEAERTVIERFVRFRISPQADADDVLQETYIAAFRSFDQLKDLQAFKPWILRIARNKCNDYFRRNAVRQDVSLEELPEAELPTGRFGLPDTSAVADTMELLNRQDRQILSLYFWDELPQAEIAGRLHIPIGTVKSRMHTAKQNFRKQYPYLAKELKGEFYMKKMPERMPEYTIEESTEASFPVKWEELMGWFLVPKLGEKLSWAMYDMPSRKCSHVYEMAVTGKAKVHGIEGVELTAREASYSDKTDVINRTFVAQLTDTHCRYLATLRNDGEVHNYITFLDEEFTPNWGFGENNCGNETNLTVKGDIHRIGHTITTANKEFLLDIVGRYTVTIGSKHYDTICVMDIEAYNCGVVAEQFLDKNGKTILWRRFNRDDWAIDHYGKKWTELLPENEQITVNGQTYVHWYDCITDYIFR